ncbi:MAG TPA: polyphosphate polymerase domain-containing protein [Myxococcota bacterium]|nr:polyphosphate polymerase domain-containing protein [Myxococcota bacterium]
MAADAIIERREYKYLIAPAMIPRIRRELAGICHPDPYGGPDGRYPIRSLYLDTRSFQLAESNRAEAHTRFKVRVRSYPSAPSAPAFLEVKRRFGDVIRKSRVAVPASEWPGLLSLPAATQRAEVASFVHLVTWLDLRPAAVVEYDREAWVSDLDDYGRVTFDLAIGCQRADDWSLSPRPFARIPLDYPARTATWGPVAILEMKWAGPAPVWMRSLVQRLELIRYAYSKYGSAIEELSERRDLPAMAVGA